MTNNSRTRAGVVPAKVLAVAAAVVAVVAAAGWAVTRSPHDEIASFAPSDGAIVRAIAASPDGRTIATASGDGAVRLFDADTGRQIAALTGHTKGTTAVAFSPDGKAVASGSLDETVKVWNPDTGDCTATLTGFDGPIRAVAFSPDGKLLAAGECKKLRLWSVGAPGNRLRTLPGHKTDVIGIAFLDGGKTIASVGCDKTVRYWDAGSGKAAGQFAFAAEAKGGHLKGFSVSADGTTAVTALQGQAVVLDLAGRAEKAAVAPKAGVLHGAAVTPDGRWVAAASENRGLIVWDAAANAEAAALRGHDSYAAAVAALPDGRRAVTGGKDGSIKVWRIGE